MKIAILSDSHDHIGNMKRAIQQAVEARATTLLFCGDFCAPPLAKLIGSFPGEVHVVFGNNDGDRFLIAKRAADLPNITLHGEYAAIVIDGKKIGMTHYPFYAEKMAKSGDFDLVCFGHDHDQRIETYGACLAVNPGCLNPAMTDSVSLAVYDTATHQAELLRLAD